MVIVGPPARLALAQVLLAQPERREREPRAVAQRVAATLRRARQALAAAGQAD